jgi:hypothetical protein
VVGGGGVGGGGGGDLGQDGGGRGCGPGLGGEGDEGAGGGMSPGEVEAWLTRRPGPEDVRGWAAARLPAAEAERLWAEGADGEALLRLARRDRDAAAARLRFAGALGAVGACGARGSRRRAWSGPAEEPPAPLQGGGDQVREAGRGGEGGTADPGSDWAE